MMFLLHKSYKRNEGGLLSFGKHYEAWRSSQRISDHQRMGKGISLDREIIFSTQKGLVQQPLFTMENLPVTMYLLFPASTSVMLHTE